MFRKIEEERPFVGILKQIINHIQNGSLKPGEALPAERSMAETMGVSRAILREAIRALELLGLVKSVPGGGNYITENLDTWLISPLSILFRLNNGGVRQNQQLRAALERENAILAAKKCTSEDAEELLFIIEKMEKAEDEKERGKLDKELHQRIGKIADNPMIYSILTATDTLTEYIISGIRDYIMKKNQPMSVIDAQHRCLVEAIIRGDAKEADRYMSEHMITVEEYMSEMLEENK